MGLTTKNIQVAITSTCFFGSFSNVFPNLTLLKPGLTYNELSKYQLVIFPGGADVDPANYGDKNFYSASDMQRDKFEFSVIETANACRVPMYGSCRGAQVLAVRSGTSLVQDIGIMLGDPHRSQHALNFVNSMDDPMTDSLSRIFKGGVNSLHHQGVSVNSFSGIIPVAHHKGILEIFKGKTWLATQFHPEIMANSVQFFNWLVEDWLTERLNQLGKLQSALSLVEQES